MQPRPRPLEPPPFNDELTFEDKAGLVRELVREAQPASVDARCRLVLTVVSNVFDLDAAELKGPPQRPEVRRPRRLAMALCCAEARASVERTAALFGCAREAVRAAIGEFLQLPS
jgi:chromosomal replication initiation ATPase DnaA